MGRARSGAWQRAKRIEAFGLRLRADIDYELVNPEHDERYRDYWETYYKLTERRGVTQAYAKIEMRRRHTLIGAMMIKKGHADGMICGTFGIYNLHLNYIEQVIGKRPGTTVYAAMNTLMLPGRQVTLVDTHVNEGPTGAQLAEITMLAADELKRFGIEPKVALLSHSNFGTTDHPSALRMREALRILREKAPELEVDGEMHGDVALDADLLRSTMPNSTLKGEANLLVLPGIDSANISYNLLKTAAGNNVAVGPVLLGVAAPINILTSSATVRRIVNMTAWTVVDINSMR